MTKLTTIAEDSTTAVISEMSGEAVSGLISLDEALVAKVVGDDPDPMFVTLEVLNEGVSRNGRYYDLKALQEVAEQINSEHPDGYAGHITQSERATKVPDAEVIWLGSKLVNTNGKNRLFAKGYVLPEAKKRRSYLEKAKAIGKNVSVSIYGTAKQVWDKALKAYRQMNIDLESIDFTRPKSEGVPNGKLGFALTSEMASEEGKSNEEDMEKTEVLKSCSKEDFRLSFIREKEANTSSNSLMFEWPTSKSRFCFATSEVASNSGTSCSRSFLANLVVRSRQTKIPPAAINTISNISGDGRCSFNHSFVY